MKFIILTSVENNLAIDPNIHINPDKICRMVRAMKTDTTVEHTQIWYGSFTNEGYEAVERVLEEPTKIKELILEQSV